MSSAHGKHDHHVACLPQRSWPVPRSFADFSDMRVSLLLVVVITFGLTIGSAVAQSSPAPLTPLVTTDRLPGVDLAEGITQLTGVAISPLLGVSAVGAWRYYKSPEAARAQLPWFCHPYVWSVGFFLISLCFLKDLFGAAAPPLIKKPLDAAELFESKLSALVACSAFLPFVVSEMARHTSTQASLAISPELQFASVFSASGLDIRFITFPLAILAFLVIWLAGHAINVLIALCPFGFIDGILKLLKALLLASIVVASLINPYFGAAVSLVMLFIAYKLAPWAFRLTVFGTLFGLDLLLPKRGRRLVCEARPHAFLAHDVTNAPTRTYGRLTKSSDNEFIFTYRPWLVFPERLVAIPPGDFSIAKGLLFPSLLHSGEQGRRQRIVVMFLPRYRSREQAIASHFEVVDIQDGQLIKGFRAIRAWLAETVNFGKSARA